MLRRVTDLEAAEQIRNLKTALESRGTVGVAIGMVMRTYELDQAQAFAYLSRRSQDSNVKLRDLALLVIEELQARETAGHTGSEAPAPPSAQTGTRNLPGRTV